MASKLALRSSVEFEPDSVSTRKCATPVAFSQNTKVFFFADSRFFSCVGSFGKARIFFKIALPAFLPERARQRLDFTYISQQMSELSGVEGTNCGPSRTVSFCLRRVRGLYS